MKTRTSFISNSSSSSFVVVRCDVLTKENKKYISEDQEQKLEKYGFKKTLAWNTNQIDRSLEHYNSEQEMIRSEEAGWYNYCYSVTCNQDDVIYFLIKNKIPFVSSCHYDHEVFKYTPENDVLTRAINFGNILLTYGEVDKWYLERREPLEELKGADFIQDFEENFGIPDE